MDTNKSNILNDFLPNLKSFIKSETVIGEPYTVGDTSIIPINSVKVGFAYGDTGLKKAEAQGGGGGVTLTPVAFIILKGNDISIHSLNAGTIENMMSKFPEVVDKFVSIFKKAQNTDTPDNSNQ